jgi:hypothetical protein
MSFFRQSVYAAECGMCHARFEPESGGVCERCKRILCGFHLHGGLPQRLRVYFGAAPVCVKCRANSEPTDK